MNEQLPDTAPDTCPYCGYDTSHRKMTCGACGKLIARVPSCSIDNGDLSALRTAVALLEYDGNSAIADEVLAVLAKVSAVRSIDPKHIRILKELLAEQSDEEEKLDFYPCELEALTAVVKALS